MLHTTFSYSLHCIYSYNAYIYEILHHFFAVIPNITSTVCSQPVISGNTAVCHCNATANPGANISWLRNGVPVKEPHFNVTNFKTCDGNNPENRCVSYSTLKILDTKWADHGSYVCKAQNKYHYYTNESIHLIVQGKLTV